MYYHYLIISIFEPLVDTATDQDPSPRQLVAEAKKHLQTLVRLYYLRHGFEAMDLFIVVPLMQTGFECLKAIDEELSESKIEILRSTLILVAKGLNSQRRNHHLGEALFRVIRGRMRPQEAALLRGIINIEPELEEKQDSMQVVRSSWPVSVVKKKEDVDANVLNNLVESYAHLNIEGETEGYDSSSLSPRQSVAQGEGETGS